MTHAIIQRGPRSGPPVLGRRIIITAEAVLVLAMAILVVAVPSSSGMSQLVGITFAGTDNVPAALPVPQRPQPARDSLRACGQVEPGSHGGDSAQHAWRRHTRCR